MVQKTKQTLCPIHFSASRNSCRDNCIFMFHDIWHTKVYHLQTRSLGKNNTANAFKIVTSCINLLNCTNNQHTVGNMDVDSLHLSPKCSYFTTKISRPCKFLHIRYVQYIQAEQSQFLSFCIKYHNRIHFDLCPLKFLYIL
jgi:hypothetical protein